MANNKKKHEKLVFDSLELDY